MTDTQRAAGLSWGFLNPGLRDAEKVAQGGDGMLHGGEASADAGGAGKGATTARLQDADHCDVPACGFGLPGRENPSVRGRCNSHRPGRAHRIESGPKKNKTPEDRDLPGFAANTDVVAETEGFEPSIPVVGMVP